MRPTVAVMIALLFGLYGIGGDTTDIPLPSTAIEILVGAGSYDRVTRDCGGGVTSRETFGYREIGVSLTHDISAIRLRAAGGVTTSPGTASRVGVSTYGAGVPYVAPSVGLNLEGFGWDLGYLFNLGTSAPGRYASAGDASGTVIGGIRIGPEDRFHFTASHGMQTPLSAATGLTSVGMGGRISDGGARLWLGAGGVPGTGVSLAGQLSVPVLEDRLEVVLRGHIAVSGEPARGIALGTRVRF